jgi:hypothetical protein
MRRGATKCLTKQFATADRVVAIVVEGEDSVMREVGLL